MQEGVHKDRSPARVQLQRRTGIIHPAYIYDDIQVLQEVLISGPDDLSVPKTVCLLQHEASQSFVAMKRAVVCAYLHHFALRGGVAGGADGHNTGMRAVVSAES